MSGSGREACSVLAVCLAESSMYIGSQHVAGVEKGGRVFLIRIACPALATLHAVQLGLAN